MAETGPTGCQTWGVVKTQWLTIWSARHFGKQNRDAVKNGQFQQQLPKKKFWLFCWLPWCFRMLLEYTFLSLFVDSPNKTTCKSYPWPPGLHGLRKFLQRLKKLLHHRHRIFMSSRPRLLTNSANISGEKKTRLFRGQMFLCRNVQYLFTNNM